MQFQDELAAGVVLVRPALQSPDYQPGLAGWAVKIDGSAEFSDIVIRGGGTQDPVVVGNPNSPQVIIRTSAGNGLIVFPTNRPVEQLASTVGSAVIDAGLPQERAELQINGPTVTGANGGVRLVLQSQPQNNTNISRFAVQNRAGTEVYFTVDQTECHITGRVLESEQSTATATAYAANVTGDAFDRVRILTSGSISWGSGAAARDVTLSRSGVRTLAVTGALTAENWQSGSVNIMPTVADQWTANAAVVFPTAFASVPVVMITCTTNGPGVGTTTQLEMCVTNTTTTGCNIRIRRGNLTNTTISWLAVAT